MTHIRITKSSECGYWYDNDFVGSELYVLRESDNHYEVIFDPRCYPGNVLKSDCIVIDPPAPAEDVAMRAAEQIVSLFELKYSHDKEKAANIIRAEYAPLVARAEMAAQLAAKLERASEWLGNWTLAGHAATGSNDKFILGEELKEISNLLAKWKAL